MSASQFIILLVEDNPGDARLVMEALSHHAAAGQVRHVADGAEALAFLRREGAHHQAPRPALILLDLNLPRCSGREVLAVIKADTALRRIPVVVLTTSQAEDDVLAAYNLHANCYVPKPPDLEGYLQAIGRIEEFWLRTARLPSE